MIQYQVIVWDNDVIVTKKLYSDYFDAMRYFKEQISEIVTISAYFSKNKSVTFNEISEDKDMDCLEVNITYTKNYGKYHE